MNDPTDFTVHHDTHDTENAEAGPTDLAQFILGLLGDTAPDTRDADHVAMMRDMRKQHVRHVIMEALPPEVSLISAFFSAVAGGSAEATLAIMDGMNTDEAATVYASMTKLCALLSRDPRVIMLAHENHPGHDRVVMTPEDVLTSLLSHAQRSHRERAERDSGRR